MRCRSRSAFRSRNGPASKSASRVGNIVLADHGLTLADEALGAVPAATIAARAGRGARLLRQAPSRHRCRRASGRRSPERPLTHGFDLRRAACRADRRRRGLVAGELAAGHRPARGDAAHRLADRHARHRHRSLDSRGATCWPARRRHRLRGRGRGRRPRAPALRRRRRMASGPIRGTGFRRDLPRRQRRRRQCRRRSDRPCRERANGVFTACAIRCRPRAASSRRTSRRCAATRRRPSAPRSARSRRPTMRRRRSAGPTCSAPRPPSAGPAAGTPSSSRPTASAAATVDAPFETRLRRHLERFRMAGYDLEVNAPRYVPLDVALHICVQARLFPRRRAAGGASRCCRATCCPMAGSGVFHPDNFTFGQPVYLSRMIAAAQAVEGVDSVRVDSFQRLVDPEPDLARGRRDRHRRPGDRPARQQSQFPRARPARRSRQEAANERARARPEAPCAAAAAGQRVLRLLRRHRSRNAAGPRSIAAACRRSPTASATMRSSAPACMPRCRPPPSRALRALRTRDDDDFTHRPDRRLRLRGRCADLLPGADRQRILSAHGDRARLAAGDGQARRLPAAPGRGGRDLARLRARYAADAAGRPRARAGQFRHRRSGQAERSTPGSRCRAFPAPTRSRRRSRRSKRWPKRAPRGTPCGPG